VTEKRPKRKLDPTELALQAADQALTRANAAVQAAVKAIALSRKSDVATRGRGTGAIRKAASQARGRMRGAAEDATGQAPLSGAPAAGASRATAAAKEERAQPRPGRPVG